MFPVVKVLKSIYRKVDSKSKLAIIKHLIISIMICFLDFVFYDFVGRNNSESSIIIFNIELSYVSFLIGLIITISLSRLFLLYSSVETSAYVGKGLNENLLYSYLRKPYLEFKTHEKGFYINKLTKHIDYTIFALFSSFQFITGIITVFLSSIYIFSNSDANTIFLFSLTCLLFLFIAFYSKKKILDNTKMHKNYMNKLSISILNSLSSFREIFLSKNAYDEIHSTQLIIKKTWFSGSYIAFYSGFSKFILEPIIFITAILFIMKDQSNNSIFLNPGILFSLLRATTIIQTVFASWSNLMSYKSFVFSTTDDINFIFNKKQQIYKFENKFLDKFKDNYFIKLKNVSFKYDDDKIILDNVSFNFTNGTNIIYGPNGTGKSTILDIISGLIKPESGEVYINDYPIWKDSALNPTQKRQKVNVLRNLSYVSQNNFLKNDTVLKNITGFASLKECDTNLLKKIMNILNLGDIPENNSEFLNKLCGENGSYLSGGQKQKIAIAKALYKKPYFLFMDESLSNIDLQSKINILNNLYVLDFLKIVIIVTHDSLDFDENSKKCFLKEFDLKHI